MKDSNCADHCVYGGECDPELPCLRETETAVQIPLLPPEPEYDYPRHVIHAVLQYREVIDEIKVRSTSKLTLDTFKPSDPAFFKEEGNTLRSSASQSTRVAQNTNRQVEDLCVITADIDLAIKNCGLTMEERFALIAVPVLEDADLEISNDAKILFESAMQKMFAYLNKC